MGRLDQADAKGRLPALVSAAARSLASAESSAEVLEARDMANVAYHAAKTASRIHSAKGAHDTLIDTAHQLLGDALGIESAARIRLADEYDAAQERGEVVGAHDGAKKRVADDNAIATAADLGLRRDEIHSSRQLRDAAVAYPGLVRRVVDTAIDLGQAPTKARLYRQIKAWVLEQETPVSDDKADHDRAAS